jgi:hypothetical protein
VQFFKQQVLQDLKDLPDLLERQAPFLDLPDLLERQAPFLDPQDLKDPQDQLE